MAGETKRVRYVCLKCGHETMVTVKRFAAVDREIVCRNCHGPAVWSPPRVGVTYNTKMATRGRREAEASGGGVDK
jgi:DNA-directed RNA polymerase subunit RPC12/RpoP